MDNKRSPTPPITIVSQDITDHAESPKRKRPRLDESIAQDAPMLIANAKTATTPSPVLSTNDDNGTGITLGEGATERSRSSSKIILDLRDSHDSLQEDTPETQTSAKNCLQDPAPELVGRSSLSPTTIVIPHASRTPSESPPVIELFEDDPDEAMNGDYAALEFEDPDTVVFEALNSFPYADQYGLLEALHMVTKAVSEGTLSPSLV